VRYLLYAIAATMFLVGGCGVAALAQALPASQEHSTSPKTGSAHTGFAGDETCALCHSAVATSLVHNPHSALGLMHGRAGFTCESCHGPGQAHVEAGGDKTKILQLSKASPKVVDATCLTCHAGAHPNFERSQHAKAGVGCTSCHSIHSPGSEAQLLKVAQPLLCYQCHTDVKPAFAAPFHHKVNEGLVKCSDCHDVHGTFGNNNIKSTADQNAICTKCHTETRGPFVFEHATVKGEGCLGCHSPHGSQNARLLNVPNVNQLCNQCHSPVAAGTVHGINAGSAEVLSCISCHTMIHGSNINPAFIR